MAVIGGRSGNFLITLCKIVIIIEYTHLDAIPTVNSMLQIINVILAVDMDISSGIVRKEILFHLNHSQIHTLKTNFRDV